MQDDAKSSRGGRAREASERVYAVAIRALAALVVLLTFAGLAYLVFEGRIDGGALLLYAGVILGYVLNMAWQGR